MARGALQRRDRTVIFDKLLSWFSVDMGIDLGT
jgi:hypothetical protein